MENKKNDMSEHMDDFLDRYQLHKPTSSSKGMIIKTVLVGVFIAMLIIGCFFVEDQKIRALLVFGAIAVFTFGVRNILDINQGEVFYECMECSRLYKPDFKAMLGSKRRGNMRFMKCPYCGGKYWHKKTYVKTDKDNNAGQE